MKEICQLCRAKNEIEMEDLEKGYFFCKYCGLQNNFNRDQLEAENLEESPQDPETEEFDYGN